MLVYSMGVSVDGFIADREDRFDWGEPGEDQFRFHIQEVSELGSFLCGRKLYETMLVWDTDPSLREDALGAEFADVWCAIPKVVFSRTLDTVEGKLRAEARPGTGVVRAHNGHVDITALLGLGLASEDHLEGRDSAHELEHGGEGHEHDDFDSFSITLPGGLGRDELLARIGDAIRAHDVLRLKGFAALPGSDARLAIQAVGPRINAWFDRPWKPGEARRTGLVVIGESPLDRAAISARLMGDAPAAVAAE